MFDETNEMAAPRLAHTLLVEPCAWSLKGASAH